MINGPEAFTPDNEFCLGETEIAGLFVAAGFCAHGLAGAGGIGRVMAEWIAEGEPSLDLWHMDIRRFGRQYRSPAYTVKRVRETYETYYDILYPHHERESGRRCGFRRPTPGTASTPPSARSRAGSGSTGTRPTLARETMTCARAAGPGATGRRPSAPSTGVPGGGGTVRRELVRQARALRPGAAELVERLCDNRWPATWPGHLHPDAQPRGGIECDFTVARLAEDRFGIVTGTAFGNHDREWIRRHLPGDGSVQVQDLTSASACFGIWGRGRATCSLR